MIRTDTPHPTLQHQLAAPITIADADVVGPLAVFPLIASASPKLQYVSFATGRGQGVSIKELEGGAQVNDLAIHNPLDVAVLLYEGEEVIGAQQNRTFDVSALVPARSVLRVPVSCVEAGRWDHSRRDESFAPAPQAAYPALRRMKNARVRQSLAEAREPRAVQHEVWDEVAAKSARHGVDSHTGAMHDVFERRREHLDAIQRGVTMKSSQVGMLAAIGGRFVVLDYVSDVEAFATLHGPLLQGYALDALEVTTDAALVAPSIEDARDFVALLLGAPVVASPAIGLGQGLRFDFGGLAGTALAHERELVAATAFGKPAEDQPNEDRAPLAGRVRRPSRRRPR